MMNNDDKLALQYRMIDVWDQAFKVAANTQDFEKAREEAGKAVEACKKAVGLE